MEVILDELTPVEFFDHGGIVKLTVNNDEFVNEYGIKSKYTFFDNKSYSRFFRNLYITYIHNHPDPSGDNPRVAVYKEINKSVDITPTIGKYVYTVDTEYDYETAKFYYFGEKVEPIDVPSRDPYGIKNVCFSLINETDERWDDFMNQRLERGFDESELWNLDGTIAKFIYPRLKEFYEVCPNHPINMEQEVWLDILKQMVDGFELMASDVDKSEEEFKIINNALKLFSKYFLDLWN